MAGDQSLIGLEGTTLNRRLTGLRQLFEYVESQGVAVDDKMKTANLRSKNKKKQKRAREQRLKLPLAVSERVFHAAPFVDCASWKQPRTPGAQIYHRLG